MFCGSSLRWALATLLVTMVAQPEPQLSVDARGSLYQDSDATTINTNIVSATVTPVHELSVRGYYLADIISSASVDVVSAATERWDETRHEVGLSPTYDDDTRAVSLGYRYSTENDWSSHSGSVGLSHDFFSHDMELSIGAAYTANTVGRADDANFQRDLGVWTFATDAVVTASKNDLIAVGYSLSYGDGYQASPYRFVQFRGGTQASLLLAQPEIVPDLRVRHAVTLRYNRHLFRDTALRSFLRGYTDDWGVRSVTLGTEYVVGFGEFDVGLGVRGYRQEHATFYQDVYPNARRYMTADRELSTFWDVFGTGRLSWRHAMTGFFQQLRAEAKATAFYFRFENFARLPERDGIIAELALGGAF